MGMCGASRQKGPLISGPVVPVPSCFFVVFFFERGGVGSLIAVLEVEDHGWRKHCPFRRSTTNCWGPLSHAYPVGVTVT